jgi:hypothetical protein
MPMSRGFRRRVGPLLLEFLKFRAAGVCRDLGCDLIADSASISECQLAVLDESGVAIFRFRAIAEKL